MKKRNLAARPQKKKRPAKAKPNARWKSLVDTAEYFGVVPITIKRWQDDEKYKFPEPAVVADRRYWSVDALEAWMKSRVGAASSRDEAAS